MHDLKKMPTGKQAEFEKLSRLSWVPSRQQGPISLGKNIFINKKYHNYKIHTQMEENMKKIVFTLALVAAMCVCSTASISAGEEERFRFHFRTVNFPNDTFTQLLGINDEEMIAGYHGAATNVGFVFSSRNNFTLNNYTTTDKQELRRTNKHGYPDVFYIDAAGTTHAFLNINAPFTTVISPATTHNLLLGLNNLDQAAGIGTPDGGTPAPA